MKKRLKKIIIASILFIIALIIPNKINIIKSIVFITSYIIVGVDILKKALRNIKKKELFDENLLMSIATLGAFLIKEFPEAVAVMLFYQIGELFQSYAVDKSRKSITSLMDIRPDYANVYRNNKIIKIDTDEVKINEIIMVKPGEKIPLDGIVIDGESMIDTKALTGESIPKHITKNDTILSGTINIDGTLKIKVQKEFDESTVSKILELVENASTRKSKSENFITKFSKIYTPTVVIIACILALILPIILNQSFNTWIYRALSFLVVSCPCALVISIPLSFFSGIGAASKIGVLVKGSNYLEKIANTEIIVCDKTGTLTEGIFEVQKVIPNNIDEHELIKYTAYIESISNHPIANSIKKYYNKNIDNNIIKNAKEISGYGIIGTIDNKEIIVGNEKIMKLHNIDYLKNNEIGTIIYIAIDKEFKGSILISDKIKEDTYKAIKELKKHKIDKIIMLTGDKKENSEDIAKKLEIKEFYAELLPNEKVEKVEELINNKKNKKELLFIGDGINDAPVLAISDIGVSMGGVGSDAAIEASDIVLMTDKISQIATTINISKKTMKIVRENIFFAISVKIFVLLLSAIGISTMWEAVFADVGVSVIAILNALRILRINKYNE